MIQQQISQEEYDELKSKGYTDEQIRQAIEEQESNLNLESSYNDAIQQQQNDPRSMSSHTLVSGIQPANIVEWQLELDSILERVEHLLRGDKPKFIKGNIIYVPPETDKDQILNEHGVSEIMRILTLYINRNTILSNYDEDTIMWKVHDFGKRLADLMYLKYDEFGLDTPQKRKLYEMLVYQLVDVVHSAYLRALNGGERESIRKSMSISQQILNPDMAENSYGIQRKERAWYNPARLVLGKYK